MRKMFRSGALLIALMMGASGIAEAGPITLRLTSGASTTTIVGAGNIVIFSGLVGTYQVGLTAGSSNNPGITDATLDVSELSVRNTASNNSTLLIELSQTGFLLPPGPTVSLSSSASATFSNPLAGDTVTFQGFVNDADVLFGLGGTSALLTLTTPGCGSAPACTTSDAETAALVSVAGSAPYALTSRTVIDLSNGDPTRTVSGSGNLVVSQVPDGGSTVALLGSVLFAFGAFRRKFSGR